jgi:glycosyltransferase involved in cell wall biosynthesis
MERLRTVLFLSSESEMGGGEKSLFELVRNMDQEKFRPVVMLPEEGSFSRSLRAHQVKCVTGFRVPGFRRGRFFLWPLAILRLAWIAVKEKADIIHGNGTRENIAAGFVGRLLGIPTIWHLRNLVPPGMRDLERPLAFLPTRIIANSRAVARRMKRLPWARRKLWVVHNGVDMSLFEGNGVGEVRGQLGVSDDQVLVGLVGRMGVGKGHEVFLDAAVRAGKEEENLKFALIGGELFTDEGREEGITRLIDAYGLSDRIACTGHRPDVERYIKALDILVLASEREPFGRVLIEAMAAGRSVVATDAGGVQEVVEGGVTALLVPPRDPAAMALAIVRLSRDRNLRERMGKAGRDRVREKFSIENHVSRIQGIYSEILNGNGRK